MASSWRRPWIESVFSFERALAPGFSRPVCGVPLADVKRLTAVKAQREQSYRTHCLCAGTIQPLLGTQIAQQFLDQFGCYVLFRPTRLIQYQLCVAGLNIFAHGKPQSRRSTTKRKQIGCFGTQSFPRVTFESSRQLPGFLWASGRRLRNILATDDLK
jgi:hypothetical protein